MLVQDILDLAKIKLGNLAISKNNNALIKMIYLGESELFRRFNLSIKSETIRINSNLSLYELRNNDVALLLSVYDREGVELKQSDVIDSRVWDYKIINYKSFILNKPSDGLLYAVYKASPIVLADPNDEIDLPDAMIDALLLYVAYMAHSTITSFDASKRGGMTESDLLYQKFIAACNELDMQGYKIPLNTETLSIRAKGYV